MFKHSALSLMFLSACGLPADPTTVPADPAVGSVQQAYRDKQGPSRGVAATLWTDASLSINDGSLRVNGAEGATLVGRWFSAYSDSGTLQNFYVYSAELVAASEYRYKIYTITGGAVVPLCGGEAVAAVPGRFDPATYYRDPSAITLSCESGVINKCLRWGYKPWSYAPGGAFMACVRMAMADYCSSNQSNTISGTDVDLYDRGLPTVINSRSQAPNLALEGIYVDPGWQGPVGVLCLAKRRWDALPPQGPCATNILRDPRLPLNINTAVLPPDPTLFCESRTLDQWLDTARGRYGNSSLGLIINDSAYTDAGLARWRLPGGLSLTSGRYNLSGAGVLGETGSVPSGASYTCFEGRVFSRQITAAQAAALGSIVALNLFTRVTVLKGVPFTQHWVTTQTAPSGYTKTPTLEGYIYPPSAAPPAGTLPLYSYAAGIHGYVTTTQLPWPTPATARLEGHVLAPYPGAAGCIASPY